MATMGFPPRQCLTCASSGDACDGGLPIFPWQKSSFTASPQNLGVQVQTPLTSGMAVFTENYLKSEHGALIRGITSVYGTLKSMQRFDDMELKSPPQANFLMGKLTSIGLETSLCMLQLNLDYDGHYVDFLMYPSTARLANSVINLRARRGIPNRTKSE
ncbi:hypothetical protein M430DRAFT_22397 [Amorphotheca resinae ATCC 22711]|uniref:Uncharacterized protein n=1 Tax=Amorphotheca resinae ATCC 22711 TaxID=857342 RepID=A0A2T3ARP4_AMORE|nr:hypothetical protein M430DRAFT_22397 [Amorphotheca resinae ATCC 22711]PSS09026.1 hypothetical protein M430DRAFT_22397 [Amorphotheca resinae ATCC 22711]